MNPKDDHDSVEYEEHVGANTNPSLSEEDELFHSHFGGEHSSPGARSSFSYQTLAQGGSADQEEPDYSVADAFLGSVLGGSAAQHAAARAAAEDLQSFHDSMVDPHVVGAEQDHDVDLAADLAVESAVKSALGLDEEDQHGDDQRYGLRIVCPALKFVHSPIPSSASYTVFANSLMSTPKQRTPLYHHITGQIIRGYRVLLIGWRGGRGLL